MDLIASIKVMLRRWYVVVPVAALMLSLTAAAYSRLEPSYQAGGSLILHGPPITVDEKTGESNPYASAASVGLLSRVASDVLSQKITRVAFRDRGFSPDYAIAVDPYTPAVVTITAIGDTPAAAKNTAGAVMKEFIKETQERQVRQGAPRTTLVTVETITQPVTVTVLNGSRLQAAAALLAVGAVTTVAAGFAAESLAAWRRRRQFGSWFPTDTASTCPVCEESVHVDDLEEHLRSHAQEVRRTARTSVTSIERDRTTGRARHRADRPARRLPGDGSPSVTGSDSWADRTTDRASDAT